MAWSNSDSSLQTANAATQNSSAPFRDGLHSGRLDAERGAAPHAPAGRWSTQDDRASFTAGYNQGYNEAAQTK